ncbi:MAG: hypothetical protein JOZ40_05365 [Methylobacteriaceae bacterium]|nr:hypothetical protein [Methylobacteriaceae bacterium]
MVAQQKGATPSSTGGSGQWVTGLPRLGFISTGGQAANVHFDSFREGLRQAGQIEGQTFLLEARFSEGENDRLPALAAELVALPVDLIAVVGAVTVRAVRRASAAAPRLVELATAARIPTMLPADLEPCEPLLTFGSSLVDGVRLMAKQADRVLRGARPGDLPVEVVTRHRLTINRRVAREIGVTVPPDLLARADQVVG